MFMSVRLPFLQEGMIISDNMTAAMDHIFC